MNIALLGSTGSIGTQALDVARMHGYRVVSLTANSNIDLLEKQAREFKPECVAVAVEAKARELKTMLADTEIKVLSGNEGVCTCASLDSAETVLNSVVGIAGLLPTVTAIKARKKIALANKETLVAGGKLIMSLAREYGSEIIPVDSEHSAIFQCLNGEPSKSLKKIILTASGGPFFGMSAEELCGITPAMALKHPNWNMGAKITVDSSTLMNKGLEFIEAMWLFGASPDMIEIVVHRQSIIHSMVEFSDNAIIAQLGAPDMRIPIQYALTYPERLTSPVRELTVEDYSNLTFSRPDYDTFRCLSVALSAAKRGGLAPCAANAANEAAVELFLNEKITYPDIPRLISLAVENQGNDDYTTVGEIMKADLEARQIVYQNVGVDQN